MLNMCINCLKYIPFTIGNPQSVALEVLMTIGFPQWGKGSATEHGFLTMHLPKKKIIND